MTEKQYTMYDVGSSYLTRCGVEAPDGDCFENMTECCDELNRLLKENEQLKIRCGDGEQIIRDLKEENTQLKSQMDSVHTKSNLKAINSHKKTMGLMEENEWLKQQLKEFKGDV